MASRVSSARSALPGMRELFPHHIVDRVRVVEWYSMNAYGTYRSIEDWMLKTFSLSNNLRLSRKLMDKIDDLAEEVEESAVRTFNFDRDPQHIDIEKCWTRAWALKLYADVERERECSQFLKDLRRMEMDNIRYYLGKGTGNPGFRDYRCIGFLKEILTHVHKESGEYETIVERLRRYPNATRPVSQWTEVLLRVARYATEENEKWTFGYICDVLMETKNRLVDFGDDGLFEGLDAGSDGGSWHPDYANEDPESFYEELESSDEEYEYEWEHNE